MRKLGFRWIAAAVLLSALAYGTQAADRGGAMQYDKKYTDEELRKMLTPEQYSVARKDGTEPPFANKYWNNHEDGIYVDVVSGEPLFSSKDKFESGTGWPSF